ncbi:hypothetical protein L1887_60219 [Cichorium endivia]|nr:hypothetical protein L1887_60219 [Cichorium endivia]
MQEPQDRLARRRKPPRCTAAPSRFSMEEYGGCGLPLNGRIGPLDRETPQGSVRLSSRLKKSACDRYVAALRFSTAWHDGKRVEDAGMRTLDERDRGRCDARETNLLVVDLDLAGVDALDDGVGVLAIDGAADGLGGAEDLLDGAGERLGERLEAHLAGDLYDLLEGDVATVLDVLLLLAVARGLLERLDDERGGRGDDRDGSLTVLDGKLDGDAETLPVAGGLGDVLTDLLGRETKRTDLGGKRRRGTDLTTGGTEVDDLLEEIGKGQHLSQETDL